MDFEEIQQKAIANAERYGRKHSITIDQEFISLKMIEELGEFAEALLTHDKKSRAAKHLPPDESKKQLGNELADVVGMAMVAAHILDIDLQESLTKKWITKEN